MFHIHRINYKNNCRLRKRMSHRWETRNLSPQRRELWTRALTCCSFVFSWRQIALGSPIPCLVWQEECVDGKSTHWHLIVAPVQQSHRADICPDARGGNVKNATVLRRRALFLTQLKATDSPVPYISKFGTESSIFVLNFYWSACRGEGVLCLWPPSARRSKMCKTNWTDVRLMAL